MNYRHAFHAGNFADCFKHALVLALADALARKPAPFYVLDTHAGAGRYDLDADEARRTGEAELGIRRLLAAHGMTGGLAGGDGAGFHDSAPDDAIPLHRYLSLVSRLGLYPGSPVLLRAALRPQDRLACCELHPEDASALRRVLRTTPNTEVHLRSGWEALGALLPPREKRGLVFIDPPFEARDEFATLAAGLRTGHVRFRNGIFAAWYPVKQMAAVRDFHATMRASGIRDVITVDLHLREPSDPARLNGCGLLVINPPWQFPEQALVLARAVLDGLAAAEPGAGAYLTRLADE